MIDPVIKRCLGQMMHGVQVVGASHDGVRRAYTSHWVTQVSFEEPIVMASVSPRHDTFPLLVKSGLFAVSVLAGDQVAAGQYFSYPGRKFHHIAEELLTTWTTDDLPVVPDAIAWLRCEIFDDKEMFDHRLFFGRVTDVSAGRLREPPLTYSSRLGWRIASDKAREPGVSVRDELLERLAASGLVVDANDVSEDE
ncbi:MAG: flavin reductase family protein [Actinomycetota bacterium]|nr:flavin reductase family protein [Actinomycetota bacterium]MDA2970961.1 flavin reductase family protein [Actinomycetota bacterium]MDA3000053.1 flavin reductase family protein [Actinomycetota bacterium]